MNVTKLADKVAHNIEHTSSFLKQNWKSTAIIIWMLLVTSTLIRQEQTLQKVSSYNQVANMRMSVDDVRYSVDATHPIQQTMPRYSWN